MLYMFVMCTNQRLYAFSFSVGHTENKLIKKLRVSPTWIGKLFLCYWMDEDKEELSNV